MKIPSRRLWFVIVVVEIFIFITCAYRGIVRLRDKENVDFNQMIREIMDYKVIMVGESHDQPKHHEYQLKVIDALYREGVPVAVGLEMFRADGQDALDKWVSGETEPREFIPVYYRNWGMPWSLYQNIFMFARNKKIPLLGLNVSNDITKKISRRGFSSLTEDELKQLPPGISCDVDNIYKDFIRQVYSGHGSGRNFVNFCEVQMVWDSAMAMHTLKFLKEQPERTVVILAGVGHAWRRAVPERIRRMNAGCSTAVIVPEASGRLEKENVTSQDADFMILGLP